jgi:hypothetical protein
MERSTGLAVLAAAAVLATAATAGAHALGLSRGEYTPRGAEIAAELVLRSDDAAVAAAALDADHDGRVTAAEVEAARPALQAAFIDSLAVSADGAPCQGALREAVLDPPDGVALRADFTCPHPPSQLTIRPGFLERLPSGHRHLATVHLPGGNVDVLAAREHPGIDVTLGGGPSRGFFSLLRAGVEHILSGADHLAFLVALVLGGTLVRAQARARGEPVPATIGPLIATLTAFTVGHSVSLAVATLGGLAPPPRLVEAAVALSVAYVGAENLLTRSVRHRWAITLPFGCVHGFAFAGGLLPLGLPRAQLPGALLAFNLGVEAGQIAVLAALMVPLSVLHARGWYPSLARGLSFAVTILGLIWFGQRMA